MHSNQSSKHWQSLLPVAAGEYITTKATEQREEAARKLKSHCFLWDLKFYAVRKEEVLVYTSPSPSLSETCSCMRSSISCLAFQKRLLFSQAMLCAQMKVMLLDHVDGAGVLQMLQCA